MNDSESTSAANWRGVGDSLKDLGRTLKGHADAAQESLKSSAPESAGTADQVATAFRVGLASFDETLTDPAVGAAAREATVKFLDALKAELGAGKQQTDHDATPPKVTSDDGEPPASPPERE